MRKNRNYQTRKHRKQNGGGLLHEAVKPGVVYGFGNLSKVKELIAAGTNVNDLDSRNNTALMIACEDDVHANSQIIKALIEAGTNINQVNLTGETALILASKKGHTNAVRMLLAAGADVNLAGGMIKQNALSVAKNEEIRKLLRDAGARPPAERTLQQQMQGIANLQRMLNQARAAANAREVTQTSCTGSGCTVMGGKRTLRKKRNVRKRKQTRK